MTFSEMIRALRREPDRSSRYQMRQRFWLKPNDDRAYWVVEDLITHYFYYVPLPEGWVLPT